MPFYSGAFMLSSLNQASAILKLARKPSIFLFGLLLSAFTATVNAKPLVILTTFSEAPVAGLVADFKQRYPDIEVHVIYRRTAPAIRLLGQNETIGVDLAISSSASFFNTLRERQLLLKPEGFRDIPEWLKPHSLDLSDDVVSIAYSGLGLMFNSDYLERHRIPTPTSWQDLTKPAYFRHIMMSTPAQSGTTHVMVESILQQYGWKEGWALLMRIGGNLASLSARSFGVSEGIARGLVGAGPVIDNYAFNSQKHFNNIGFRYLDDTALLPTYVGLLKTGKNSEASQAFVHYLLSRAGQNVLDTGEMAKVSLTQPYLAKRQPFTLKSDELYTRQELVRLLFDSLITHQLPLLNDAWLAIYEAETNGGNKQLIVRAKKLASDVPVSNQSANDPAFLSQFKLKDARGRLPPDVLSVQFDWQQRVAENLQLAIELSRQSLAEEQ